MPIGYVPVLCCAVSLGGKILDRKVSTIAVPIGALVGLILGFGLSPTNYGVLIGTLIGGLIGGLIGLWTARRNENKS